MGLIISIPATVHADYYDGVTAGEQRAEQEHSTALYWGIGTPAAFVLSPLFGGGATIAAAYLRTPEPDSQIMAEVREEYPDDYVRGFESGYADYAQSRNTRAAWGATGVAFGARLALILAADEGDIYSSPDAQEMPVFEMQFSF